MAITVYKSKCTGCGTCIEGCPLKAISLDDDDKAEIDKGKCVICGRCVNECEHDAIVYQ